MKKLIPRSFGIAAITIVFLSILFLAESDGSRIPLRTFFFIVLSGGITGAYPYFAKKVKESYKSATALHVFFGIPLAIPMALWTGFFITFLANKEISPVFFATSGLVTSANMIMLANIVALHLIPPSIKPKTQ